MKKRLAYFTKFELALYVSSVLFITLSFLLLDRSNYLTLLASLIGVTSLIFCAKGNPVGQALMIVFSIIYGYISYTCAYYGEMITYLCMSLPMAAFALIAWLRNPFRGKRSEVKVNRIGRMDYLLLVPLTAGVTVAFYFILKHFETANLLPSTLSVSTSFVAVYLTFRRSSFFALAYAANDVVLIVLWLLAGLYDSRYISVLVCFVAFLFNDLYGFVNWQKMKKRQAESSKST